MCGALQESTTSKVLFYEPVKEVSGCIGNSPKLVSTPADNHTTLPEPTSTHETQCTIRQSQHKCLIQQARELLWPSYYALPELTWEELAKHNTEQSCWLVLDNVVYDVTPILKFHPATPAPILKNAGKDCTEHFKFHSQNAQRIWKLCPKVGRVMKQ